jgi:predicted nuclease with RNAse H fold
MRVVGVDLAGLETNETGFCVLDSDGKKDNIVVKRLLSDREILNEIDDLIEEQKIDVIAIDAPFDWPEQGYLRKSDLMLKNRGFSPLSPVFPGMKPLTRRGKMLAGILKKRGFSVIEVFSKASERIFGLDKKKAANKDEYDALVCALTGKAFLQGNYEDLDGIIIPK